MPSEFNSSLKELSRLFQQAREAHGNFTTDWDRNFPKLGQKYKDTAPYLSGLEIMRKAEKQIDGKILPVIKELKGGKRTNITIALAYLSVPDRYFHSGYNKEAICKVLGHVKLSEEEKQLMKQAWQSTQSVLSRREQKAFEKLLNIP